MADGSVTTDSVIRFLERRFDGCAVDILDSIYDSGSEEPVRAKTPRDIHLLAFFGNLRTTVSEIPKVLLLQLDALYKAGSLEETIYPAIHAIFRRADSPDMQSAAEFLGPLVNPKQRK